MARTSVPSIITGGRLGSWFALPGQEMTPVARDGGTAERRNETSALGLSAKRHRMVSARKASWRTLLEGPGIFEEGDVPISVEIRVAGIAG